MFILENEGNKKIVIDAVIGSNGNGEPKKEKLTFTIEDEKYTHVLKTVQYLKANNLWTEDSDGAMFAINYKLMLRIVGWEGIGISEKEDAPCTMDNKEHFFGQFPMVVVQIHNELALAEATEKKTSNHSQNG
jgi:hypothetical protein